MKMRDDFTIKTIDVLSKRVALRCSNPDCRKLTIGPNSAKQRTTNIGVAAHITAASPKGPRYDPNIISEERTSIDNAIWLCQSCAKLIDSDSTRYNIAILQKWKRDAEYETDLELTNAKIARNSEKYDEVFKLMPNLINEMTVDIKNHLLYREFILFKKGLTYNSVGRMYLVYYYDDHENLDEKMILLENIGLIRDITYNNTKRYILTEDFVEILKNRE